MSAWQYFRKEANPGETTEIFTDVASKIAKYKRVLAYVCFPYTLMIVVFVEHILNNNPYPWWEAVRVIFLLVLLLLTYAIIRLAIRMRQLRKFRGEDTIWGGE
jgi:membrane protein YdbS with pleckstrin-like domain